HGYLDPKISIACPGNGPRQIPQHTLDTLRQLPPDEAEKALSRLAGCYAYSLGYVDSTGAHRNLRRDLDEPELSNDLLPIMADRPSRRPDGMPGNTANHSGGQNVLFVGGNVRFAPTPNAGIENDNIYLNQAGKVAAGLNRLDTV